MKLLSSTMIWTGDIFSLYSDQVLLDHGVSAQRDLIRHPGGAAILLMRDEHILLVRQYRHGAGRALMEIPAGKLESGESPDCCARRELEEEAGFRCDALRHLCSVYPSPGICSELLHLYEAISPMPLQDPRPMDPDEDITLQWISLDEAQDMLDHGAIMDAKTIIALQHALLRR